MNSGAYEAAAGSCYAIFRCLAYARAKFKYAQEQGKDADAEYFISNIRRLCDLEEQYRLRHLTPQQIQQERQGEQTAKIIKKMRQRLDKLLADSSGMRGDLMNKAQLSEEFLEPAHPVSKRWPVQYRSLELCSLATNGTQELTC